MGAPPSRRRWTVDAYATGSGETPARTFIQGLDGRNKVEAIALVKLLEDQGNLLRRPQSGALGDGLFELRGKEIRIFYVFVPGRAIVLLDGEIKKRDDIPKRTLERMRRFQAEVMRQVARAGRLETR
jgi:phage-related protein